MSCCGGNCGCGSGCQCSGCGGCKMYPQVEVEPSTATTTFLADATHKAGGSYGSSEMAAENGGCGCNTCKCGTSCGCSCCNCN